MPGQASRLKWPCALKTPSHTILFKLVVFYRKWEVVDKPTTATKHQRLFPWEGSTGGGSCVCSNAWRKLALVLDRSPERIILMSCNLKYFWSVNERTSFTGSNCCLFFFSFSPREVFVTLESAKTPQPSNLCSSVLIIWWRFAEVPPNELRHVSLRFSQKLHSIISAILSILNLALGLESPSFFLSFSELSVQ